MVVTPEPGPAAPAVQVKSLKCPNCGAQVAVRSFEHAVTVVCRSCHSILDAKDPNVRVLQQFKAAVGEASPLIPLGARGKLRGVDYVAIGFQRRTITVEEVDYSWHEYLLFNPYKGYRYLTEYNGHWNDVVPLKSPPIVSQRNTVTYLGETYRHFQTAQAKTTFVLGEFPWQVRVGEKAQVADYVRPPHVVSSETTIPGERAPGVNTVEEVNWSAGEYMTGADVWKAFALSGDPPRAVGVYANQPSPYSGSAWRIWRDCALFLAALGAVAIGVGATLPGDKAFEASYRFNPLIQKEASTVTDIFALKGHPSGVRVETVADVDNNWIYLNYALINADTDTAYDFGREVSYYHGVDSGESWSEGSKTDDVVLPNVPPGNYYLRIEPEGNMTRLANPVVRYRVTVVRGVQVGLSYLVALMALVVPAALVTWRSMTFEGRRWAESDHGGSD